MARLCPGCRRYELVPQHQTDAYICGNCKSEYTAEELSDG